MDSLTKMILFIGGESNERVPIITMLKRFGYIVRVVDWNQEAEVLMKSQSFDLIIVNDRLKDGQALEFMQRIREEDKGKIIILSSKGSVEEFVQIVRLGAFECVRKPISPVQFAVIVCEFFIENLVEYQMPFEKSASSQRVGS